jgi:hypothetical protein
VSARGSTEAGVEGLLLLREHAILRAVGTGQAAILEAREAT